MRRRTALLSAFTALPALLALGPLAASPAAGGTQGQIGCPVTGDGMMLVAAPQDTTTLRIDADADSVDAYWNGSLLCTNEVEIVTSVEVSRNASSSSVIGWGVISDSPLPGPVVFLNAADDYLDVITSGGIDKVTTGGPRTVRVDRAGARNVIRLASRPSGLSLELRAGEDVVDTTTDTRWITDVMVTGNGGAKQITTGVGDDAVYLYDADDAAAANDTVSTGRGDDFAATGNGADRVVLGAGDDEVELGAGRDRAVGGSGADRFLAQDGRRDVIEGGDGRDGAERDDVDVRRSIEYRLR